MPEPSNIPNQIHVLANSGPLARLRSLTRKSTGKRLSALAACRAVILGNHPDTNVREFFQSLPSDEKHYWIATYYALLMPQKKRKKLAAYFTPPHLAKYAIDKLKAQGIVLGSSSILDPSSGGAAFLVPLAQAIADVGRNQGTNPGEILTQIRDSIAGIEIDKSLVKLSELLVTDLLSAELSKTRRKFHVPIMNADTLEGVEPRPIYDAVVGNPPYGRVFKPSKSLLKKYSEVISDGYVNKYALFVLRSIAWARPGGIICLIIPMSFLGGPYFAALRKFILCHSSIVSLDPIDERDDLFMDALCDVCVLTLRKNGIEKVGGEPTSSLIQTGRLAERIGVLDVPSVPSDRIWALPGVSDDEEFFNPEFSSLLDYGYSVKAGYFVWNREQHRYRVGQLPRPNEVPLYWAHNIKANGIVQPLVANPTSKAPVGFVTMEKGSLVSIKSDAILLQRTSNRRQKRRLIAGMVYQRSVIGGRGFVSENHTILILPEAGRRQTVPIKTLCRLLNSAQVDSRFRRISGTVSVSVKALRTLPLPPPSRVLEAFSSDKSDDEAAEEAYRSLDDGQPITEGRVS